MAEEAENEMDTDADIVTKLAGGVAAAVRQIADSSLPPGVADVVVGGIDVAEGAAHLAGFGWSVLGHAIGAVGQHRR